ncbi:MAG TPA: NUDIX domain-containing protein [Methylomirabilota bacterium]|jgi:8-oxo-dGTP pyrophosphatase MutT (NUDIX family)
MSLPHRIAAGAIVVRDDSILLVRHSDPAGGTFLVAPGGGVLEDESVADAAVRETFEETGVRVVPGPVLLIEDVLATRFKMCKVWLGCDILAGEVSATEGARREGILEARWFRRPELDSETVYPWIVTARPWPSFRAREYGTEISPPRRARF